MLNKAFTMIELVFVIVVLGILAAVAIPRLAATRDDAIITKGKSQVSAIRSGISLMKSKLMLTGIVTLPATLDDANTSGGTGSTLFHRADTNTSNDVLEYPIISDNDSSYGWIKTGNTQYIFRANGTNTTFDYNATTSSFSCVQDTGDCNTLTR